jgi:hypothetical protein
MITYIIAAFIWTTHPTIPIGFVASNSHYTSLEQCEEFAVKDREAFQASIGNFINTTTDPPIKLKRVYKILCMTSKDINRLNALLGHK